MRNLVTKSSLIVLSFMLILSCKKEEKTIVDPIPETPDPYTYNSELQSSKDVSFANSVISDIDMICAYAMQGISGDYEHLPSQPPVVIVKDTTSSFKYIAFTFNNSNCLDGRSRNGAVYLFYEYDPIFNSSALPNARNYESYGFSALLTFNKFEVDGWKIQNNDSTKAFQIRNTLEGDLYDPAVTNLTWEISGELRFTHSTDPSRNIVWKGTIKKTLKNTSDTTVFANKNAKVNWQLAKLEYSGNFNGTCYSSKTPYTYKIDPNKPLYRDMSCSYSLQGSTNVTHFHPFVFGTSTFTVGDYHPRTIDYGPTLSCDNKANISFKSETHTEELD